MRGAAARDCGRREDSRMGRRRRGWARVRNRPRRTWRRTVIIAIVITSKSRDPANMPRLSRAGLFSADLTAARQPPRRTRDAAGANCGWRDARAGRRAQGRVCGRAKERGRVGL